MDILSVGKRISEQRKNAGLTQEELAEKIGISTQAVSKWENGHNLPDIDNLLVLSEVLGVPYTYIVGGKNDDIDFDFRARLFHEDNMYTRVKTVSQTRRLTDTLSALGFMRDKHEGQLRKGSRYAPDRVKYINHPLMMACHAFAMGVTDDAVIASILLHDVLEDTDTKTDELPVSDEVKEIVSLLTFDKEKEGNSKAVYFERIRKNKKASVVKIIDRCNNISTMAGCFSREKMAEYIAETEEYVMPLFTEIKNNYPEYSDLAFLVKYQVISLIESTKALLCL